MTDSTLLLAILLPLISAFIGWLTNLLAVKMLFHPRTPLRCFGLVIHGVFPKRQRLLAHKVGELVSTELFSTQDLLAKLKDRARSEEMLGFIAPKVEQLITVELPKQIPMMAMVLNSDLVARLKAAVLGLMAPLIEGVIDRLGESVAAELDVHKIVEEKIAGFSPEKTEALILSVMKREFRFIELVGAVLGFAIGCVQVALMFALQ